MKKQVQEQNQKILASKIILYYSLYKLHIKENDLEDFSRGISCEDLIAYVDKNISVEYRIRLLENMIL